MVEKKNSSGRGQRDLQVRVKTAKGRRSSSTRWLKRQLNDPYVQQAKKDGFRGRAAYKIRDLDDKYRFLVPGARVVDLGCAPGSWARYAKDIRRSSHSNTTEHKRCRPNHERQRRRMEVRT